MKNKNIFILIEAMTPFTKYWGGCQRAYHYGQKFLSEGYNVHVICRNQSELDEGVLDNNGLIVSGLGAANKESSETQTQKGSLHTKNRIKEIIKRNPQLTSMVKNTFRFVYSEPNALDGMMSKKWATKSLEYIEKYIDDNEIDVVIISGPPFGLFYTVKSIKKHGVKVVLDYRDPWTLWYEKTSIASIYERYAIKHADLVVAATDSLADAIRNKYRKGNVHSVLNGYDIQKWNAVSIKNGKHDFTISHIGLVTLNADGAFRDPSVFLKAANAFVRRHPDARVQFVGVKNPDDGYAMGLDKRISFLPPVSVECALEMIAESDVLVAMHTIDDASGKYIICGKIYDYLRSGNLILSIGDKAFANKAIVENNKSGLHCNNNAEDILNALEELYCKHEHRLKLGEEKETHLRIEQYSREYQNAKFLRLIRAL